MNTKLRRIWLVARWEFLCTIRRASFIAVLVGLPVAHIALAALIGFSVRSATSESEKRKPVVVVDTRAVLTPDISGPDLIVSNLDAAIRDLKEKRVEAVYVLDDGYLDSGKVRSYAGRQPGMLELGAGFSQRARAVDLIRKGLVRAGADSRERRLVQPILDIDAYRVHGESITVATPSAIIGALAGPFGVCFVLALSIFFASGSLQQAMSAEVQNRMLEVILPLVPPLEMLTGKVLGLAVIGLLQVVLYLGVLGGGAPVLLGGVEVSLATAAWSALVFIAGYILFAVLLAGTGALSRDSHESTQIASVWMLIAAIPFFFITQVSADSSSMVSTVLTWFPPTAPVAILLRIGVDGISTLERAGAIAGILLGAVAALTAAAAVFRARLLGGGRLRLKNVFSAGGAR